MKTSGTSLVRAQHQHGKSSTPIKACLASRRTSGRAPSLADVASNIHTPSLECERCSRVDFDSPEIHFNASDFCSTRPSGSTSKPDTVKVSQQLSYRSKAAPWPGPRFSRPVPRQSHCRKTPDGPQPCVSTVTYIIVQVRDSLNPRQEKNFRITITSGMAPAVFKGKNSGSFLSDSPLRACGQCARLAQSEFNPRLSTDGLEIPLNKIVEWGVSRNEGGLCIPSYTVSPSFIEKHGGSEE